MTYQTTAIIETLSQPLFSSLDWEAYAQASEKEYYNVVASAIAFEFEAKHGIRIDVQWDAGFQLFYLPCDDSFYTAEGINNRLQLGRDKDKLEFGGIWFPWDDYTPTDDQHWDAFLEMSERDIDSTGLFDDLDDITDDDSVIYGDD